jgi:hypothetical protein
VRSTSAKVSARGKLALDPRISDGLADSTKVVFLDVETTGLSWFYDDLRGDLLDDWCAISRKIHLLVKLLIKLRYNDL